MKVTSFYTAIVLFFIGVVLEAQNVDNSEIVSKNVYNTSPLSKSIKIVKKKGDYALVSVFGDEKEIAWAQRFNIVEMGNVENPDVSYAMLDKKGLLKVKYPIGYDWMPAFYYYTDGKNREFVQWLYSNKEAMTLNPKGPFVHCKENHYDWCQDYYYNLSNRELVQRRVNDLIVNMKLRGFRGLFFDWASGSYIKEEPYKSMKQNFKRLHTQKSYLEFVSRFYKKLNDAHIFVVTNQGFREASYILPFVQYDMTESYITTVIYKKMRVELMQKGWVNSLPVTNYYPIYKNSNNLKDSLVFIDMLSAYKKKYKKFGFKNFIYLNYLAPAYQKVYASSLLYREIKPKNGIYFSYAMAKLADNMVYAEVSQNRELERDEVYFYDLGAALGKTYKKLDAIDGYIRFYEKGFVLVSQPYNKELYLQINSKYLKKDVKIYDVYENKQLCPLKNKVTVDLKFEQESFSSQYLPLGRVYLYI